MSAEGELADPDEMTATTQPDGSGTVKCEPYEKAGNSFLPAPSLEDIPILHTIDDVLIERCQSIPNHPLVGYPSSSHGSDDYHYYTATDLDRFVNGTVDQLVKQGLQVQNQGLNVKNKVVALLGVSNLDYVISIFSLSRMGYTVLFLSTRLSTEAYINLLNETECHDILCTPTMEKAVAKIKKTRRLRNFSIPAIDTYTQAAKPSEMILVGNETISKRVAFIIHSSGSTGLPKPIFQTHKACLSNYAASVGYRAFLTLPLFHNHGLSTLFRAILKAVPIAIFNANIPLTGTNILRAFRTVEPESFHCVPYALKLLSETTGGIEALAECEQVLFGGSSCPDDIGDKLVAGGVRLISHYGVTEMGQLMSSRRPMDDKAWNYVRPLPNVAPYLSMQPLEDGSFECVVLEGAPSKVTSNSDDPPNSFHTSDCFIKHPIIPNAWKYLGRIDDRVTLVNGEKVLPIPIEHRIRQNQLVKDALVFGVGKEIPGLLVIPSDDTKGFEKSQLVEKIWPDVEAANEDAEKFSQISKEMIGVLDFNVSYPSTDKGTMIRQACYRQFAELIETIYLNFEAGTSSPDGGGKVTLSVAQLEDFLLHMFRQEVGVKDLEIDSDFFDAGVDSLQAVKARGIIKRDVELGGADIGQNVIFDCGNTERLAVYLYGLRTGRQTEPEDEIDIMSELIDKYSNFHKPTDVEEEERILLTGVTGTLGIHVLSQLIQKLSVRRIYCLTRASSSDAAFDRVVSALTSRSLPLTNLSKVRAFPSNISEADLGLGPNIIDELRDRLTKVVHIAWAVNFNLGLRSFEQQHIKGLHNLINLSLASRRSSPPPFFFCSSISAAAGTPLPAIVSEGPIPELSHAQNMGYARSKLVAERIVQNAAEKTGMTAKVLRVGQIVGDTVTGQWNTTEAIPLIIQSATTLKALPALDETPSWLPVDIVAQAILDLCDINKNENRKLYTDDPQTVYHVQNSLTFHWTTDLLPALKDAGLEFDVLPQREWVRRLRYGEQDPQKNPAIKLLDFFTEKYDNDKMGRKDLVFESKKTEEASPTLRGGVELIRSGLIKKYVEAWRKVW